MAGCSSCCSPSPRSWCRSPSLGYLPIAWVNVRNNRARTSSRLEQTELQRERGYLEYLMTEPLEAKEIRAYGIGADAAPVARGLLGCSAWPASTTSCASALALSTLATVVTTAVLIGTLSLVADPHRAWLALDRRRGGRHRRPAAAQQPAAVGGQRVQRRARGRHVPR